jgi:hypothetical protein
MAVVPPIAPVFSVKARGICASKVCCNECSETMRRGKMLVSHVEYRNRVCV